MYLTECNDNVTKRTGQGQALFSVTTLPPIAITTDFEPSFENFKVNDGTKFKK